MKPDRTIAAMGEIHDTDVFNEGRFNGDFADKILSEDEDFGEICSRRREEAIAYMEENGCEV